MGAVHQEQVVTAGDQSLFIDSEGQSGRRISFSFRAEQHFAAPIPCSHHERGGSAHAGKVNSEATRRKFLAPGQTPRNERNGEAESRPDEEMVHFFLTAAENVTASHDETGNNRTASPKDADNRRTKSGGMESSAEGHVAQSARN